MQISQHDLSLIIEENSECSSKEVELNFLNLDDSHCSNDNLEQRMETAKNVQKCFTSASRAMFML